MLEKIKKIFRIEFIRFLFTGGLNTLVGYIIYVVFYSFFRNTTIAIISAYLLCILFNFKSYSILVFNSSDNWKIPRFIIVYIIAFVMNYYSLYLYCDVWGLHPYIGQIIVITYVPVVLYFLLKYFVFVDDQKLEKNEE